jgi:hypothetical protein
MTPLTRYRFGTDLTPAGNRRLHTLLAATGSI